MAGSQRRGARGATAVYRGAHGATSAVYVRMDVVERMGMINKRDGDQGVNEMVDLIHKYVYTSRPREKAALSLLGALFRFRACHLTFTCTPGSDVAR